MLRALVAALFATSVLVALAGIRSIATARERRRISERLEGMQELPGVDGKAGIAYLTTRPLPLVFRLIALFGWALPHLLLSESLQWHLFQAGYRRADSRRLFAGFKVVCALLVTGTMALIGGKLGTRPDQLLLMILGGGLAGFLLPNLLVFLRVSRRRDEILVTLPDALDLMVVCVEAGQGLNAALLNVGREIQRYARALSEELYMVNHEVRMGLSRAQALRNFARRSGVGEARALAAVLIQSDRLGTSVAKALRVHAQSLRTRRRQRAEEMARKTAVKLVFPLVLCIFPELLVVILGPASIKIMNL